MGLVPVSEGDSEIVVSIRSHRSKAKPIKYFRQMSQPAKEAQGGKGWEAGHWKALEGTGGHWRVWLLEVPVGSGEGNAP